MALPSGQAQPNRHAFPVDNCMDFCREPASGTTETIISIPIFYVTACWWGRTEVLVDYLDVTVEGGGKGIKHPILDPCLAPHDEAVVASGSRTIPFRQIALWRAGPQPPEDAVQHASVIDTRHTS